MLEKKIEKLGQYFDSLLKVNDGLNAVRVILPETWVVYDKKTDKSVIKAVKSKDGSKVTFVGVNGIKHVEIMDFVIEVVINNIENERKKQLYKDKISELAKIFDSNNLSYLENLVFKFDKPKKNKSEVKPPINDININYNPSDVGATEELIINTK